jgi:hypothetical protein
LGQVTAHVVSVFFSSKKGPVNGAFNCSSAIQYRLQKHPATVIKQRFSANRSRLEAQILEKFAGMSNT